MRTAIEEATRSLGPVVAQIAYGVFLVATIGLMMAASWANWATAGGSGDRAPAARSLTWRPPASSKGIALLFKLLASKSNTAIDQLLSVLFRDGDLLLQSADFRVDVLVTDSALAVQSP